MSDLRRKIIEQFDRHIDVMTMVREGLASDIEQACLLINGALVAGHKVLIMGNGGSAADSQHFAAELVGRFLKERRAYPAIALSTDTSILTAVGNDYGFERVFSRQVEALAEPGDVIVGISTSGNSANVVNAVEVARAKGCKTIALLGGSGGKLQGVVDLPLTVPVAETPHVQEAHATIIHIICNAVDGI